MTCFLSPIVGVADTSPEGGSITVFASEAKQSPGRVNDGNLLPPSGEVARSADRG